MNAPIRKVTIVVIVLFSLLFLNLNWVQFVQHQTYTDSAYNTRTTVEEYSRQRGSILAGSETLAKSTETKGKLKYQREYPEGEPYAHLVGYKSLYNGSKGLERYQDDILSGDDPSLFVDRLSETFTGEQVPGGNVVTSLNPKLQKQAWEALQGFDNPGAAVAVDPKTGQILAQVSTPSYDDNPMASHDTVEASEAIEAENAKTPDPMLDRSTQDFYPPGSVMKIITAATALEAGITPDTKLKSGSTYKPPQTDQVVKNAANQCSETETLRSAFAKSCNTTFARLCVENFEGKVDNGAESFVEMAETFGFGNDEYATPLPVIASQVDTEEQSVIESPAFLAQACFGQNNVRATPMMMALSASIVANGGDQMAPNLIKELQAPDKTTLKGMETDTMTSIDSGVAEDLKSLMESVVEDPQGTGGNAKVPGATVGGKTGTAENGDGNPEHGWFAGFAMDDNGEPKIAVSVFLSQAGDGGSGEATRIAGELMKTALGK
ncbi:peptidoglycan D,D-transpeptidase FtsI family protein [Stackebrandtia nassauensis]|uniref:Penicillin-binding protein transpeptidase n=1 Tax=Stackebrandtia nassauensis (strain DSM 44728 / CIP 108903 / NRRL B-16338 / NBRC 102104 / LLR-40K-21) TaxID=446470 RepID=D3Q5M8_STANL|nr:penicillin-binding protein 2 [Stackebrandtia nassauensis]ADD46088.1 penicillin-binding protein transpeptidase [Stackebrandtia nassauensis DSM 44728]